MHAPPANNPTTPPRHLPQQQQRISTPPKRTVLRGGGGNDTGYGYASNNKGFATNYYDATDNYDGYGHGGNGGTQNEFLGDGLYPRIGAAPAADQYMDGRSGSGATGFATESGGGMVPKRVVQRKMLREVVKSPPPVVPQQQQQKFASSSPQRRKMSNSYAANMDVEDEYEDNRQFKVHMAPQRRGGPGKGGSGSWDRNEDEEDSRGSMYGRSASPPLPAAQVRQAPPRQAASPNRRYNSERYMQQEEEEEPLDDRRLGMESGGSGGSGEERGQGGDDNRLPCSICGRKFLEQERLDKHMVACAKVKKERKIFDASKARVKGTDLEKYANQPQRKGAAGGKSPSKAGKTGPEETPLKAPKSNWRAKHESFLRMVRAAKEPIDTSSPSSRKAAPPIDEHPDYITCDHCGRRFSEEAAERHMPVCAESKRRAQLRNGTNNTQLERKEEAFKRRMSFRPPPLKNSKGGKSPKK
ncbi:hypothetical protein HK102_013940 [Quaeritorhiza haematococci]|nr:hypothetical protein HK102_013940 [Quaeritorhiza haematococci]